jgi:ABC-type transport system substrate-binding protein
VLWPIWPGGPIDGAETAVPDFDPAAAAKLLAQAGWIDTDKDGIRDKAGKQLHVVLIGGEHPPPKDPSGPPQKTERDYFVEAARRAGVVIDVKTGGESFIDKRRSDGSWDLLELSWGGMVDMDITQLVGSKDPTRPADPRIAHALDAMGAVWDPAERGKLSAELAAGLAETWPIAGVVAEAPQGLVHKRLLNVKVWDGWLDLAQLAFDPKVP